MGVVLTQVQVLHPYLCLVATSQAKIVIVKANAYYYNEVLCKKQRQLYAEVNNT